MAQGKGTGERSVSEWAPRRPRPSRSAHIVHLTAEYWPYVRTGGLGEAVRGMATFQSQVGSAVTVILPLFRKVREGDYGLKALGGPFTVQVGHREEPARLWEAAKGSDGPRVIFVENDEYFGRAGVYGEKGGDYSDNHLRFSFLAAAAVQILPQVAGNPGPLVLHMHDWHTALAVVYLRALGKGDPFADWVSTVLSVHNGGFQGHFTQAAMAEMGLPPELYHMDFMEWYGRANVLKGGLVFTDMATTVSPSHSFELRTEAGGFGLHYNFLDLHDRLMGILNGIDYRLWDPETDPHIEANYSAKDFSGKALCKAALQREYGLPEEPNTLLVAMVARLAAQKGLDLILGGRALREADAQFIFLGGGEARFEEGLSNLAAAHPDRVAVQLDFTDVREHRVMSGADALLMPSQYEPCGLTQMRAMRYGAPAMARRVGGLDDTIKDGTTGLLFADYKPERLDWLIERGVARFKHKSSWYEMAKHAMAEDFSWERAVTQYFEVYDQAFEVRAEALNETVSED